MSRGLWLLHCGPFGPTNSLFRLFDSSVYKVRACGDGPPCVIFTSDLVLTRQADGDDHKRHSEESALALLQFGGPRVIRSLIDSEISSVYYCI